VKQYAARFRQNRDWENNLATIRVNEAYMKIKEICNICGISSASYSGLQNGMISPLHLKGKKAGDIKSWVVKVLKAFGCTFEDAFPLYVCDLRRSQLTVDQQNEMLISDHTQRKACGIDPDLANELYQVLQRLTEKQKTVIFKRFYENKTLKEINDEMGFGGNGERIRQIEAKALRILRHPSLSKFLKPYMK